MVGGQTIIAPVARSSCGKSSVIVRRLRASLCFFIFGLLVGNDRCGCTADAVADAAESKAPYVAAAHRRA
jgi:hypothetical protein